MSNGQERGDGPEQDRTKVSNTSMLITISNRWDEAPGKGRRKGPGKSAQGKEEPIKGAVEKELEGPGNLKWPSEGRA